MRELNVVKKNLAFRQLRETQKTSSCDCTSQLGKKSAKAGKVAKSRKFPHARVGTADCFRHVTLVEVQAFFTEFCKPPGESQKGQSDM